MSYFMHCTSLLQEELSRQISSLIHSFQDAEGRKCEVMWFSKSRWIGSWLMRSKPCTFHDDNDDDPFPAEFLYLESFLQTFKREWTGIDRLRMDKFFQVSVRRILQEFHLFKEAAQLNSLGGKCFMASWMQNPCVMIFIWCNKRHHMLCLNAFFFFKRVRQHMGKFSLEGFLPGLQGLWNL